MNECGSDLVAFVLALRRKLRPALILSLACGLAAGLGSLLLEPRYRSEAAIMPLARQDAKLSGLAAQLLTRLPLSERPTEETDREVILAFLQSRILRERLIVHYDLLPLLYPRRWDKESGAWKAGAEPPTPALAIQEERLEDVFAVQTKRRSEVVSLSWEARDPDFAALMLGRVVEELRGWLDNEHVTQAKAEREFTQEQFEETARGLAAWERRMPSADVPLSRIEREVAAGQSVYSELKKQLALAGINEARQRTDFKVLDPPFRPAKPAFPRPWLISALAFAASFCLGLFGLFALDFWRSLPKDGERAS